MSLNTDTDVDFLKLTPNPSQFEQNYQFNYNCIERRLLFAHALKNVKQTRLKIQPEGNQTAGKQNRQMMINEVPNIKYEDEVIHISQQTSRILKQILLQKNTKELNSNIIFLLLARQYKFQLLLIIFFYSLEMACRLGFSILLQILFQKVADINNDNNLRDAYIIVSFCGVIWFIGQSSKFNASYQVSPLVGKIRSQLIFLIFAKLSKISQYTAKTQQLGRVINLLSNDFNTVQTKTPVFITSLIAPFCITAIIIILITRFGWHGILIAAVILLFLPFQVLIGKINGKTVQKINLYKDKRVKTCTQIIEGIKFIKLYGWEIAFKKIIQELRKQQTKHYFKLALGRSFQLVIGNTSALYGGFTCFLVVDLTDGGQLTLAKIFATMDIIVTLRLVIYFMGMAISNYYELQIIFQRICSILNMENKCMVQIDQNTKKIKQNSKVGHTLPYIQSNPILSATNFCPTQGNMQYDIQYNPEQQNEKAKIGQIIFRNLNGYWKTNQLIIPTLQNLNLKITQGSFVGITGKIGSGKSGLLGFILDEVPYYSGYISKNGSVAYVQQQPIIFSTTIRQNIIFGKQFNEDKYIQTLQSSCLKSDLNLFEFGDQTIVGERGVTLSGGQKARLAYARALYFNADIYILDDPLSAVDSKVAKKLNSNFMKMRGKKTIILVTHQISYLYSCDSVVIMQNGCIVSHDEPQKIKQKLQEIQNLSRKNKLQEDIGQQQKTLSKLRQQFQTTERARSKRKHTITQSENSQQISPNTVVTLQKQQENFQVTWRSFVKYLFYSKLNYVLFPIVIGIFLFTQTINVIYFRILSQYGKMKEGLPDTTFQTMHDFWLSLGLLLLCYFIFSLIKNFFLYITILNSNQALHENMVHGIVRSPSSYFDITPSGLLNNKFSNDLGILDNTLQFVMIDAIEGPIAFIILLVNVFQINVYFIIPGVINLVFIVFFFSYCKQAIISSKQLDLKLKSPIFSMVGQMINGLIQIRIFSRRFSLLNQFAQKINNSLRGNLIYWNSSKAFATFIGYFTSLTMWIGWIIGLAIINKQNVGLYSVSVIFLLQISNNLQWYLRQIILLQSIMVSVERTLSITNLKQQKGLRSCYDEQKKLYNPHKNNQKAMKDQKFDEHKSWQQKAIIKLHNFSMRYRPQLPLVLKNIGFQIKDKEKVGIVGRTGAGKSSIIQAIFRLCEPEAGSIYQIGDCDALQVGLHTLRQNISVIPQTPFLFRGTIKKNLDPLQRHSDQRLWQVLEQSNLKEMVEKLPDKLSQDITNISQIFSVGQKQLLCLARALLRKNKFLVLDEATSNVDMATDHFIQNCVKTKFKYTTVITIAHRLLTIADYDKIIVINEGSIIEMGPPYELLLRKGRFSQMVDHTGSNAEIIRKLAKASYQKKKIQ